MNRIISEKDALRRVQYQADRLKKTTDRYGVSVAQASRALKRLGIAMGKLKIDFTCK